MKTLLKAFELKNLLLTGLVVFSVIFISHVPGFSGSAHAELPSVGCASGIQSSTVTPGREIITNVFQAITTIMSSFGEAMYKGIIGNSTFQNIVAASMSLYIAVYALMVALNMVSARLGEVAGRLTRMAIFYALLTNTTMFGAGGGWDFFDKYIGSLFMGGMNELIYDFTRAADPCYGAAPPVGCTATALAPPATGSAPVLDANAVSSLFAPMDLVFRPYFLIAIISLMVLNFTGFIIALGLMWGLWHFTMMIIGALITYIKAIVGLAFLFGVAPIFIVFLLFTQTRNIFMGWVNQVLGFAIAPVLMFAFLSFYTVIVRTVLENMFSNVDFCWGKSESQAGLTHDYSWWNPARKDPITLEWNQHQGDWVDTAQNPLPPAISIVNVTLFLLLSHLGNSFCKYIETISKNISASFGAGVTQGSTASQFIGNTVSMGGSNLAKRFGGSFHKSSASTSATAPTTARAPTGGGTT